MNLKEFKSRIDEMYKKYGGEINVDIDILLDDYKDDTIHMSFNEGYAQYLSTQNIRDITEAINNENEVVAIVISNYIMQDNNWGKPKDKEIN